MYGISCVRLITRVNYVCACASGRVLFRLSRSGAHQLSGPGAPLHWHGLRSVGAARPTRPGVSHAHAIDRVSGGYSSHGCVWVCISRRNGRCFLFGSLHAARAFDRSDRSLVSRACMCACPSAREAIASRGAVDSVSTCGGLRMRQILMTMG
jgi:hypothetical protein